MTAALNLQKKLFEHLAHHNALITLLNGQNIFDDVPDNAKLPYIVFGKVESLDGSTATEDGEEHFLEIEIWSARDGRKQTLEIAAEVRQALAALREALPLVVTSDRLINVNVQKTITERQNSNQLFRATLVLRAVTETL